MSEPENSQTETSSSKEENTPSEENVASDSIANSESTKESDKEDSSASLNDDNVPAKFEKLQNEPDAPSFGTTEKIDKSEEKSDHSLRENTDGSNTSKDENLIGSEETNAPEKDVTEEKATEIEIPKEQVSEEKFHSDLKRSPSTSRDKSTSEETEVVDKPVSGDTCMVSTVVDSIPSNQMKDDKEPDHDDTKPSVASPIPDKININSSHSENTSQCTTLSIAKEDKRDESEKMEVDGSPEITKSLNNPEQFSIDKVSIKMEEDIDSSKEVKHEPKITSTSDLNKETDHIDEVKSELEKESSPEKKPRLEQEIENNVPPLTEETNANPELKFDINTDIKSTSAVSTSSNIMDNKLTSSQSLSEKSPNSSSQTSSFFQTNISKTALSPKPTPTELFQSKLQAYYDSKESASSHDSTSVKPVSEVKEVRHKAIMTKPFMMTKGVSCRPHPCHKQTQTDFPKHPALVPLAVPCYMPIPLSMYQKPYPVPIPVPLPIPVPIFVPTTRNSYRGIAKQIRKIRRKIPSDPFEAEMLALAGGMDQNGEDSDDSLPDTSPLSPIDGDENEDRSNRNHRSQLDLLEPMMDLEGEIKGDRIIPKPLPPVTADPLPVPTPLSQRQGQQNQKNAQITTNNFKRRHSATDDSEDTNDENHKATGEWDGRRRSAAAAAASRRRAKQRKEAQGATHGMGGADTNHTLSSMGNKPPQDRPDAKNHLKFTYGVNAWKHWVVGKNAELEKARAQGKYMKPFETDLLKLRADELNYTLCMFVKEVKKPNGDNYAADSVLYLTYGIQEYLFENGRIDNIFTDQYYEPFTSALHEVVKDFKLPMNELGYYVTRIEEEHLWEAKQLGAHSPQVLLNTLVYFDTKYFMLRTVEDHQKLSFTHIMKHWKKPPGQKEGQKSVILRYYPPAKKGQRNDERKCYEQQESGENPLRCPIKLYEFYLSKCPESSKTRNDVFYLMPERSCSGDSPVWYSNTALPMHSIDKMLQRNLMVKEVQEHMLADAS